MIRIISIIIFCLTIYNLKSQTRITTDFKDYKLEIFDVANINNLNISAQHAQINLMNWEKDSISVETSIEILSDKPNLSKEMLKEVNIKVVTYRNTLQVKTILSEDFHSTIPYKINYNIFFPKKLGVRVKNSYGSVNISKVEGGVNANIDYCNISIKNITVANDSVSNNINLSYCKGKINHLGNSNLIANNSEIEILDANKLIATTSYNIISFHKINKFVGTSTIDRLSLGELINLSLKAHNSTIIIENFINSALLECEGGMVDIRNSSPTFKQLTVNNKNTKTNIHLNENAPYIINGEVLNGNLIHPQLSKLQIIKEAEKTSFSGEIGSVTNNEAKVIIFNEKQNIEFK